MDTVLYKIKIKPGKEELAREWLTFLKQNADAGNETLKNEKEHLETYFANMENDTMYIYMYVLADDLDYANKTAMSSENPLDKKHFEYMMACADIAGCTQLLPELTLGDFSVFQQ